MLFIAFYLVCLPDSGHLRDVHQVIVCRLQLHLVQARLDAVILTHKVPWSRDNEVSV